ncbi:MAG: hypothetical protein ICV62_01425 [Cyanobacteria bacterium Co-bin13]|nr:hypothetical protein [Cyanobacteria bacterium Co-bin13]
MTLTSQKLSVGELTARVLEMAQTGVYRESIFEAFQPVATKRQIRSAIAQAKQFGLHSVASLRDSELGTYYQADSTRYQLFQKALRTSALTGGEDLAQQLIQGTQAIKTMLVVIGGSALSLFGVGSLCLLGGHSHTGGLLWLGAALTGGIWAVQRSVVKHLV